MIGKAYIRFDLKNNKEYIYSKNGSKEIEIFSNDIGRTLIDFLANSDDIIQIIKDEIHVYYKDFKLGKTTRINTSTYYKLAKINPLFRYFDFDGFIRNYIANLRDENNTKINNCLEKIKNLKKDIEFSQSQEHYEELLMEKIFSYHDLNSEISKKGFYYINKAENATNKKIAKFMQQYGYKPSRYSWEKIYANQKNAKKGDEIIDGINKNIYDEHEDQIKKEINKEICHEIKREQSLINDNRRLIKSYVKNNERTLKEVFEEYIIILKFWIEFCNYILINFYELNSKDFSKEISPTQRFIESILYIEQIHNYKNIFEIPKANIRLQLNNGNQIVDLYEFIQKNRNDLVHRDFNFYNKFSIYSVNMIQEYSINSIEDFISISLIQILQNSIKLRKCENCDKLFISVNKSDEKYCTYKFKGNKTCRDLSYSVYLQKNELSNILRKRYRTENAKKNRNHHIPKIEDKFQKWYAGAKQQKVLCENGIITMEEFKKWFEDNKKWF